MDILKAINFSKSFTNYAGLIRFSDLSSVTHERILNLWLTSLHTNENYESINVNECIENNYNYIIINAAFSNKEAQ